MSINTQQPQLSSGGIPELQILGQKFKKSSQFMWIFIIMVLVTILGEKPDLIFVPLLIFYIKYLPLIKNFKKANQDIKSIEIERSLAYMSMNNFICFLGILAIMNWKTAIVILGISWIIAITSWSTLEKWSQIKSVEGGKQNQEYMALQEAFHSIKLAYILCPFMIGFFLLAQGFNKAAKAISGENVSQSQILQSSSSPTIGQYHAAPQSSTSTTSSYEPTLHFASPQPTSTQGYIPQNTPATFGSVPINVQIPPTNQISQNGRCPLCNAPMKPNSIG